MTMTRAELDAVLGFAVSDEQWECISAPLEPFVIVAGAGTGKTAVMAARVLWLVASGLVAESGVLGLTFTNKAAAELAHRVTDLLGRWRKVSGGSRRRRAGRADDRDVPLVRPWPGRRAGSAGRHRAGCTPALAGVGGPAGVPPGLQLTLAGGHHAHAGQGRCRRRGTGREPRGADAEHRRGPRALPGGHRGGEHTGASGKAGRRRRSDGSPATRAAGPRRRAAGSTGGSGGRGLLRSHAPVRGSGHPLSGACVLAARRLPAGPARRVSGHVDRAARHPVHPLRRQCRDRGRRSAAGDLRVAQRVGRQHRGVRQPLRGLDRSGAHQGAHREPAVRECRSWRPRTGWQPTCGQRTRRSCRCGRPHRVPATVRAALLRLGRRGAALARRPDRRSGRVPASRRSPSECWDGPTMVWSRCMPRSWRGGSRPRSAESQRWSPARTRCACSPRCGSWLIRLTIALRLRCSPALAGGSVPRTSTRWPGVRCSWPKARSVGRGVGETRRRAAVGRAAGVVAGGAGPGGAAEPGRGGGRSGSAGQRRRRRPACVSSAPSCVRCTPEARSRCRSWSRTCWR